MIQPEIIFDEEASAEQRGAVDDFLGVALEFRSANAIYAGLGGKLPEDSEESVIPISGQPDKIEALLYTFKGMIDQQVVLVSGFDDTTESIIFADSEIKRKKEMLFTNRDIDVTKEIIIKRRFAIFAGRLLTALAGEETVQETDNSLSDAG